MSPLELQGQLEGATFDGRVRTGRLVAFGLDGVFEGEMVDRTPVLVRVLPEEAASGPVLERFFEAGFFDHPALSRCLAAGRAVIGGNGFLYSVFEAPEFVLGERLRDGGRLEPAEVRQLGVDLVSGLRYLHERNLIHCGLHPWGVIRADGMWKVADYSQMRLAGAGYASETRKLMARHWLAPPEAFQGYVTPGWDSWELAQLMRIALEGLTESRRGDEVPGPRVRAAEPPEPFRSIFAGCLAPDPLSRCSLNDIERALTGAEEAPAPQPAPVIEMPPPRPSLNDPSVKEPFAMVEPAPVSRRTRLIAALAGALAGLLMLVFLIRDKEDSDPQPAPSAATPPPAAESARSREQARPPLSFDGVIQEWASAAKAGDLDRQTSLYAPLVWRFFNVTNVSRDWVRSHRQRELGKYGALSRLDLENIESKQPRQGRATVTFDKTWAYARGSSGKVRSEMHLKETGGEWKIVSERDLRTYWVKRPR